MNETLAAAANSVALASGATGTITTVHLVLMAVLAAIVIAAVVYGARLRRRRIATARAVKRRAVEANCPRLSEDLDDSEI